MLALSNSLSLETERHLQTPTLNMYPNARVFLPFPASAQAHASIGCSFGGRGSGGPGGGGDRRRQHSCATLNINIVVPAYLRSRVGTATIA